MVDIKMPQLGETAVEGTITKVPEGGTMEVGARLAVISDQSPSADGGGTAPSADESDSPPRTIPTNETDHAGGEAPTQGPSAGAMSPLVRRLVAENNLVADEIPATGGHGRLTRQDVLIHWSEEI